MPTLTERIEGGLLGLLVGDALGVPYEFTPPGELPARALIELAPPPGFPHAHGGVEPGTWSDDGLQALCLLASLLDRDRFDEEDFAHRLVDWYERGYMAVDGKVFDVGIQTAGTLEALRAGAPVSQASRRDEGGNGNGALMRVLPLALWHRGSDAELLADARRSSAVTHGHLRSQLCCGLYCLWARRLLEEDPDPWPTATLAMRRLLADEDDALSELDLHIRPDVDAEGSGTGTWSTPCTRRAGSCRAPTTSTS